VNSETKKWKTPKNQTQDCSARARLLKLARPLESARLNKKQGLIRCWGYMQNQDRIINEGFSYSFYFAINEKGIEEFLRILTPKEKEEYIVGLWKRSQAKIGLWMQGQLLLGVLIGVLVYLVLAVLGVPYALPLGVIAGLFELIPVFGPILSAVPGIALAFTTGGFTLALMVLGAYVIIQQLENNLIYPLVVTKVVGVPPVLVILALLIGAKLAGILGILLSVPLAAVLQEVFDDWGKFKKGVAK